MMDSKPDSTSDRLALIYQLSQTFNSSLNLPEVLNRVMDGVIAMMRAERGFVMLKEAGDASKLTFQVARGIDQTTIEDPEFQISRSIVERVAKEGVPLLTSDAQADERFNMRQSVMLLGLRAILCVPLKIKDRVLGVIYVDNRVQSGIFSPADLELLVSIAASAAIAIDNARLYEVAVEKGRMERELQMARRVQASLLPQETPQMPGWEIATYWKPAREVGGDYFDFIHLRQKRIGLVIADVTDKGMPAALFMASTRSILRASLSRLASPAQGIAHANHLLCAEADNPLFVTLFFASLAPRTGLLAYVNAGHLPGIIYHHEQPGSETRLERLGANSPQLGMDDSSVYRQQTARMEPGDCLLLYTDGATDAENERGEAFDLERLEAALRESARHNHKDAAGILRSLQDAIDQFTGPVHPVDDITLMIVRRTDEPRL